VLSFQTSSVVKITTDRKMKVLYPWTNTDYEISISDICFTHQLKTHYYENKQFDNVSSMVSTDIYFSQKFVVKLFSLSTKIWNYGKDLEHKIISHFRRIATFFQQK
jgi:hypothetical protein